ncbi:MAG: minichromosome maintenance protein MCM [Candidatus Woesearchaeota archaeon]|nr:minichromosome maintenance protein MCM [Candidatus Woesearchaeota archaeon]
MEASEQIKKWQEFLERFYQTQIFEASTKGKSSIQLDFSEVARFSPELAEDLLEQPEDAIKSCEIALSQFETIEKSKKLAIRFFNLPAAQLMLIRNIRSEHLGKFLKIEGVVRQKGDVRPQITSAKFECPSCGNIITVIQTGQIFREPTRCSCGRQGNFRLVSKELIDAQGLVLEEIPEQLEGGEQPKRMKVLLKDDLVSPITEKKTNPGSKIDIVGWVKEIPRVLNSGKKSLDYDLVVDANNIFSKESSFYEMSITKEEENEIVNLSKDPKSYEKLIASVAPSIFGFEEIKEALLLQLCGGVQKVRKDGIISRGDIHVLLVGDPGSGKSQMLKRISIVAPRGRYISGKGISGAGLTAAVVKDEFLGGYSLEAGALVLANKGICCIDELDKMTNEDRSAMHEALEQQTVSISKANIQATLIAQTTVLAAANPKLGRFDLYETMLVKQIDLPPTLINRFDLIFPIKDIPDRKKDEKMAKHILGLHQNPNMMMEEIPTELFRKYIAYVKQKFNPELTDSALDEIESYYVELRSTAITFEEAARTIPISPRQLEAIVRLAEASAKVRLSDKVTRKDARRAIELLNYSLGQIARDRETGKIDIDVISTGISSTERDKIIRVKEIVTLLETKFQSTGKNIPVEEIMAVAEEQGIRRPETEEIIQKLKRSGDLFEPRHGFIQKL